MAPRLKALKDPEKLAAIPTNEPVLVELEPAPTAEEGVDEPDAPQIADPASPEDDGVRSLKEQLEAAKAATRAAQEETERERKARSQAQMQAQEEARKARAAEDQVSVAEDDVITTSLARAQQERDAAKLAVKAAFEIGNADQLADAQERLGRAAADIRMYERSAAELAQRKEETKRQAETDPRQQQLSPEDAIDANPNLMTAEKVWLKAHMDSVIDQKRNQELGVAYDRATKKGLVRGTDAYFGFIEEFMGYKQPAHQTEEAEENDVPVAAPVSRDARSTSTGRPQGSTKIHLTPEQREFARTMGLTDVAYAQQVAALQRDKQGNPEKYRA